MPLDNQAKAQSMKVVETISQQEFLSRMGAVSRLERLIADPRISEQQANDLVKSFKMVFQEEGMGKRFKAFAFSKNVDNIPGFDKSILQI